MELTSYLFDSDAGVVHVKLSCTPGLNFYPALAVENDKYLFGVRITRLTLLNAQRKLGHTGCLQDAHHTDAAAAGGVALLAEPLQHFGREIQTRIKDMNLVVFARDNAKGTKDLGALCM